MHQKHFMTFSLAPNWLYVFLACNEIVNVVYIIPKNYEKWKLILQLSPIFSCISPITYKESFTFAFDHFLFFFYLYAFQDDN